MKVAARRGRIGMDRRHAKGNKKGLSRRESWVILGQCLILYITKPIPICLEFSFLVYFSVRKCIYLCIQWIKSCPCFSSSAYNCAAILTKRAVSIFCLYHVYQSCIGMLETLHAGLFLLCSLSITLASDWNMR